MQVNEIIDLSHEFYEGMPNLAESPVIFAPLLSFETTRQLSGGKLATEFKLIMVPEHCGTHLDAPRHFVEGGTTAAEVALERLAAPGHLLDFTHKGPGDLITIEDFEAAERSSGREIGPGTAVIAWTGCDKRWGEPGFETERPGVPEDAARWLVDREIGLFCTDLIGIDDPEAWWWPSHNVWLSAGVPMVQQLCNLDQLQGKEFLFVALPLKMRGSTGSPVRAVALVTD
jgi:arylformamidase